MDKFLNRHPRDKTISGACIHFKLKAWGIKYQKALGMYTTMNNKIKEYEFSYN